LSLFQLCIQNNPEEARQMLLQNPQLSYALLQAQVVMKIVNPEIAQVLYEWQKYLLSDSLLGV
jgi:cleavage stimulation factor subunit 2